VGVGVGAASGAWLCVGWSSSGGRGLWWLLLVLGGVVGCGGHALAWVWLFVPCGWCCGLRSSESVGCCGGVLVGWLLWL